jgi:hypothetical protein
VSSVPAAINSIIVNVDPRAAGTVAINDAVACGYPFMQTFQRDATIKLEAKPAQGYKFAGWDGDISCSDNPTSFQLSSSVSITALFLPVTHTITVAVSGSGSTTPEIGGHAYNEGSVVGLTASADKGWKFDGWTGDVANQASATTTVIADTDKQVTAEFSRIMHTLTVNSTYSGRTPLTVGTYQYAEGTTVDVAATSENGWKFDCWAGDVVDHASISTKVVMDSDKTVTANFVRDGPPGGVIGIIAGAAGAGLVAFYVTKPRQNRAGDKDSTPGTAK